MLSQAMHFRQERPLAPAPAPAAAFSAGRAGGGGFFSGGIFTGHTQLFAELAAGGVRDADLTDVVLPVAMLAIDRIQTGLRDRPSPRLAEACATLCAEAAAGDDWRGALTPEHVGARLDSLIVSHRDRGLVCAVARMVYVETCRSVVQAAAADRGRENARPIEETENLLRAALATTAHLFACTRELEASL